MQTAEEFIAMCEREAYPVPSGVMINTLCIDALMERDAAVALAVLAECREWLDKGGFFEHARGVADRMLNSVEAKYQAKATR